MVVVPIIYSPESSAAPLAIARTRICCATCLLSVDTTKLSAFSFASNTSASFALDGASCSCSCTWTQPVFLILGTQPFCRLACSATTRVSLAPTTSLVHSSLFAGAISSSTSFLYRKRLLFFNPEACCGFLASCSPSTDATVDMSVTVFESS